MVINYSSDAYQSATPFPHAVIDDLWDADLLREVAAEFPAASDPRWITYADPKERGKRCGRPEMLGQVTREFLTLLMSDDVVRNVEELTGIAPLTPALIGGGMHLSTTDARLAMHVDFNRHPDNARLERRINLLIFLTDRPEDEPGGILYLGEHREVEASPRFNRTVIFSTGEASYHGHPEPIQSSWERKSIAVYYYAPIRQDAPVPHDTRWAA